MKEKPLVSIIVPIYNLEKYLEPSLNSIKSQTMTDFECLMIVKTSQDKSADICRKFANDDSRFVLIETSTPGISYARNVALDMAKGDYISFIDGDDIVEATFLEDLIDNFDDNTDMVICRKIREKKFKPSKKVKKYRVHHLDRDDTIDRMICSKDFNGTSTDKLFKRDLIGQTRFHEDIHFSEDAAFDFDYLVKCKNIKFIDKVLYHYINHRDSASNADFNIKQLTCIDAFEYIALNAPTEKIRESALAWKGALAIMLLYYIKRSHIKDDKNYNYLLKVLKDSLPHFKKSKYIKWYIRWFRHFVYFVFKIIK